MLLALTILSFALQAQQTHIYLANDNHTDLFWSDNFTAYQKVALNEIDYYLDLADSTARLPAPFQSRYNLDGAWYAFTYKNNRSAAEFGRLVARIRSGHISMPYNFYVSTYGGQPAEAILRGMYWAGRLEREYDLDLSLAVAMENQTMPLGIASLWAGSGVRYSWKGVCGCSSPVSYSSLTNRKNEIYNFRGLDGADVLMKWYSLSDEGNQRLGGYAEARDPLAAIAECEAKSNTAGYPFRILGAFGYGWDDTESLTDVFVTTAQSETTDQRQIYVSNEADFFEQFENTYRTDSLPAETVTYGNDWDTDCEALASVTSKMRNSVEKLRPAEALASVASLLDPEFYLTMDSAREAAWVALGSFWEHNFGMGGCCYEDRGDWQIQQQQQVAEYVDRLYDTSLEIIAKNIRNPSTLPRFMVFNALSWPRTEVAKLEYNGSDTIQVIDLQTGQEVPHQLITWQDSSFLQILAPDIPSVGYKVFEIRPGPGTAFPDSISLHDGILENNFYRLSLTSEGVITSLVDKLNGNRELVKESNGRFVNDFGQGSGDTGSLTLLYNGPVSATVAATSPNPLQHTTYLTLYQDINRIDIQNQIRDEFGNDIRTYSFSFDFPFPVLWHEELGAILNARYQHLGGHYAGPDQPVRHDWQTLNHFADLGDDNFGIILSNQGAGFMKFGNSENTFLDDRTAQINVLIGGKMGGSGPGFDNQFGRMDFDHTFSLRTRAHSFDPAVSMRFALEHQNPLIAESIGSQGEAFPDSAFTLLQISNPGILLWALKPAEEGVKKGGLVVRLWNLDTLGGSGTIDFGEDVLLAKKTTHLETDLERPTLEGGDLPVNLGRQQIQTFRVVLDAPVFDCVEEVGITRNICEGEVYDFNGIPLGNAGVYIDTLQTTGGCDSVVTLTLLVYEGAETSLSTEICEGETYDFNGKLLTTGGEYRDTLQTVNGCDSVLVLEVDVIPGLVEKTVAICAGDSVEWNGLFFDAAGVYVDSMVFDNGCASILQLNLKVVDYFIDTTRATICEGDSLEWGGQFFDSEGIYIDSLTATGGCDSIRVLELEVRPHFADSTFAIICDGDLYTWNGLDYDSAGIYVDSLQSADGCDSLLVLALQVLDVFRDTTRVLLCEGESYEWNGVDYDSAGIYVDSLQSADGCDSLLVLALQVLDVFRDTTRVLLCEGESYEWNGLVYDSVGTYMDSLQSADGCDSLLHLILVVIEAQETKLSASICEGETFDFHGSPLSVSGEYRDTLEAANGCDSVVTLALLVNESKVTQLSATICEGETYNFDGISLDTAGEYRDTLEAANGCDSVRILLLTVLTESDTTFVELFTCHPLEAGTRIESLTNQEGCDSVVVTSIIYKPLEYEIAIEPATCEGANDGAVFIKSDQNYTYHWENGLTEPEVTNLPPGAITLGIVDSLNGCEVIEEIVVEEKNAVVVDLIGLDNYCFGGFASASAEGGTPPYSYLWNTGDTTQSIKGTDAGIYSVEVLDRKGCRGGGEVTIVDHDTMRLSVARHDVSCAGARDGRVFVSVSGGVPPYAIQWAHGATAFQLEDLEEGSYTFSISDKAGCNLSKMVVVRAPDMLTLGLEVQGVSASGNDGIASVNPGGGVLPYTITWNTGASGKKVEGLAPGIYSVTLTDGNQCSITEEFEVGVLTGASTITSLMQFSVFPNPASGRIQVKVEFQRPEVGVIRLLNPEGKVIFRENFRGKVYLSDFELGHLPKGIYQIQVAAESRKAVRSFVIQ